MHGVYQDIMVPMEFLAVILLSSEPVGESVPEVGSKTADGSFIASLIFFFVGTVSSTQSTHRGYEGVYQGHAAYQPHSQRRVHDKISKAAVRNRS